MDPLPGTVALAAWVRARAGDHRVPGFDRIADRRKPFNTGRAFEIGVDDQVRDLLIVTLNLHRFELGIAELWQRGPAIGVELEPHAAETINADWVHSILQ